MIAWASFGPIHEIYNVNNPVFQVATKPPEKPDLARPGKVSERSALELTRIGSLKNKSVHAKDSLKLFED
jgi:hypothetical protein